MSHNKKKKGKRVDDATKEGIKNVENHHLDADCVLIGRLRASGGTAVRWRRGLGGGSIGAGTPYNIIISQ